MNDSRRRRTAAASCLAVTGILLAAGCGGEASGSSTETSTSLKGTPVKVMVWAPENTQGSAQPGIRLTAQAYEKWINAHGGIKGGPLKVTFCNEKGNPDEAEKCAQQAVSDKAAAVVGSYSLAGDRYMPILQKAGIPYIGGTGVSAAEFSNPLSFPVNGGTPAVFAAHGRQLVKQGCKKITGVRYDVAAAAVVSQFLTLGAVSAGGAPPKDLKVPLTATDLAPQVAATKGSDCVSVIMGTASGLFVKSYIQSGAKTKLASVVGNLTPQLAASTGGAGSPLEGSAITGYYPPASDPVWKDFVAAAKGNKDIDTTNGANATTWVAFKVFTEAAKQLPTISAKALVKELNAATIDTGGLTPPLNWKKSTALPIPGLNRIHNTTATELTIRDGQIEWAKSGSTFVDTRKMLTAKH